MQQDTPSAQTASVQTLTKEENELIWEKQNFMLGCEEMQRITDDIVVPVFKELAVSLNSTNHQVEMILLDCQSPLDGQLYNVGVRLGFQYQGTSHEVHIVADPSDSSFALNCSSLQEDPVATFKFHETVPRILKSSLKEFFSENFPDTGYNPSEEENDQAFNSFVAPFRVQFDDSGNVSDVASTETLEEAAHMGGVFAKMFKNEKAITIIDSNDSLIC